MKVWSVSRDSNASPIAQRASAVHKSNGAPLKTAMTASVPTEAVLKNVLAVLTGFGAIGM
jgi:hypothetical protein